MTLERRKFARFSLDLAANLFFYQVDMRQVGTLIDISMGGCLFPLQLDVPLGEKCQLQLAVGEGLNASSIDISGIIVRRDSKGVGIQFINITPDISDNLKQIISQASS